jgi:hypothetical protein
MAGQYEHAMTYANSTLQPQMASSKPGKGATVVITTHDKCKHKKIDREMAHKNGLCGKQQGSLAGGHHIEPVGATNYPGRYSGTAYEQTNT